MRKFIGILGCAILLAGCASHKAVPKPAPAKPAASKPVITPDFQPVGKVARVNPDGQFVILSFSPGDLPKTEARLNVYHNGLKAAVVKVDSKWQIGNDTAADIVTGEVQVGDEVRPN